LHKRAGQQQLQQQQQQQQQRDVCQALVHLDWQVQVLSAV
jgi:hypothetical protein